MTWELFLFRWSFVGAECSCAIFRDDDRVLGVKGHGDAAAARRNPAIGFMMARLAQAERRAVGERKEDPQAFALIDDVRDRAGETVARGITPAIVDQEFF